MEKIEVEKNWIYRLGRFGDRHRFRDVYVYEADGDRWRHNGCVETTTCDLVLAIGLGFLKICFCLILAFVFIIGSYDFLHAFWIYDFNFDMAMDNIGFAGRIVGLVLCPLVLATGLVVTASVVFKTLFVCFENVLIPIYRAVADRLKSDKKSLIRLALESKLDKVCKPIIFK